MASSVSSERAFSQAGILISRRRGRLRGPFVEALQCVKVAYQNNLQYGNTTDQLNAVEAALCLSSDSDSGSGDEDVVDTVDIVYSGTDSD